MNVKITHYNTPPQSFEVSVIPEQKYPIPGIYRAGCDGSVILATEHDGSLGTLTGIVLVHATKPVGTFHTLWNAYAFSPYNGSVELRSTNRGGNYPQLAEDSLGGVFLVLGSDRAVLIKKSRESRVRPYYGVAQPSVGELIEDNLSHLLTFSGTVQLQN